MSPAVKELALTRGYIVILHGGGATGVGQVNDTDIHEPFSAEYVDREELALHLESLSRGAAWTPTRYAQDIIDTSCEAWCAVDHMRGVRGHKSVGQSIALDGSEDHLVSREARRFWDEGKGMPTLRREALETISNNFEIGTWPDLNSALADREVIVPFDVDAAFDEGQELDDRDVSYVEAADKPYVHAAEDCLPLSDDDAPVKASSDVVHFQPWVPDAPLPVQESAQAYVDQHHRLTEMFKLAQANGSAHLAMHCSQALHRLEQVHKSEQWGRKRTHQKMVAG